MKKELSRRDFLKYGALTGAAVSAAAVLVGCGGSSEPNRPNQGDGEESGVVRQTYYRVSGANIMYYEPAELGDRAQILVASMHGGLGRTLEQKFLKQLALLGFRSAFCVPDSASFPDQFKYMNNCMQLFREFTDVKKIVLMGQSRGAAVMSAYQKIAENGVGVYQGSDRRLPFPDMELEPADGLMLLDANFGFMVMHVMSMNPALIEEGNAMKVDATLDALNPDNGYAPDGKCLYSDEFKHKFLMAQRERYYRLLSQAEERWALIQKGEGLYSDNEPFIIPDCIGTNNSPKLFAGDLRFFSRTREAWPLIHPDGSVTTEIVPCLRVDENNPTFAGTKGAAFETTVKDFLWMELEVGEDYDYGEDFLTGINFESSFTCSSGNVKMISCPLLLMGHTAGYEFITAEWSYNNAKSVDKTIAFTEGATHGWSSINTEKYGDTLVTEAKYVGEWLMEKGRFL